MVEAYSKEINTITEETIDATIGGGITSVLAAMCNVISLAATKLFLRFAKPWVVKLIIILIADAIIAYILAGLPIWVGGLMVIRDEFSFLDWLYVTFSSYIFSWPFATYEGFLAHNDFTFQAWFNIFGVFLVCIGSVIPSIFHAHMVIRDVFHLAFLKWLYLGGAGLFSNISISKQPLTIILGGFGALIPLVNLFINALPWIRHLLRQ